MRLPSRFALLLLALLVAASLAAPGPASAHVLRAEAPAGSAAPAPVVETGPVSIGPAAPTPPPLWPLLLVLALAGLALARLGPARTLRLALVVLLAVFTVETGVHSVHHLADRHAATHCVVSLASAHVQGASVDVPAAAPWVPIPVGSVTLAEGIRPGVSPLRPDEGRAPPA